MTLQCAKNGGIKAVQTLEITLENIQFRNCAIPIGNYSEVYKIHFNYTSVWLVECKGTLIQNCSFCTYVGAALLLVEDYGNTTIKHSNFSGSQLLVNNHSRTGGIVLRTRIFREISEVFIQVTNCIFTNNIAKHSKCISGSTQCGHGGAIEIGHMDSNTISKLNLFLTVDYCIFESNVATDGGAISVVLPKFTSAFLSHSQFIANKALRQGGAIMLSFYQLQDSLATLTVKNCDFNNNSADWGGGVAVLDSCTGCKRFTNVEVSESRWISNTATTSGFAVAVSGPRDSSNKRDDYFNLELKVSDWNYFYKNYGSGDGTGTIAAENSMVLLSKEADAMFKENDGTVLALRNCKVMLEGKASFLSNSGSQGGAMLVDGESVLSFGSSCNISFCENKAAGFGGAIYSGVTEYCTFDVDKMTNRSLVSFSSNFAGGLGNSIYLNSISECINIKELLNHFYFTNPSESGVLLPIAYLNVTIIENHNGTQNLSKVKLGQHFYIQPTMKDILGQDSVGIGFVRVESNGYELVGPSKINLDAYTSNI